MSVDSRQIASRVALNYSFAKHSSAVQSIPRSLPPWPCYPPYRHLKHLLHCLVWTGRPSSQWPHTAIVTVRRTVLALNVSSMRKNTNMFTNVLETSRKKGILKCICLRILTNNFFLNKNFTSLSGRRLTIQSPFAIICTPSLTFNNSVFCPHTGRVLCGSEFKLRLFTRTYTISTDWIL